MVESLDGNSKLMPTNCTEDSMDYCAEVEEHASNTYLVLEIPDVSCP